MKTRLASRLVRRFRYAGTATLLATFHSAYAWGDPVAYSKIFYLQNVSNDAKIFAGAKIQTWAGPTEKTSTHNIWPRGKIERTYRHADPQRTEFDVINRGFAISDTENTLKEGYLKEIRKTDKETAPNSASAKINVDEGVRDRRVSVWDEKAKKNEAIEITKAAQAILSGTAEAGKPAGKPKDDHLHSADSFAAIYVDQATVFEWDVRVDEAVLKFRLVGRNTMVGGRSDDVNHTGSIVDPYFLDITDLNTGAESAQAVMAQTLNFADALFSIDDVGIRFTINPNSPESMVALSFSSESSWVSNPYSYSVRLDAGGLTVSGDRFPLADWQIRSTTDSVEAFFPFGSEGLAFDMADVKIPASLLADGHTYSVGAGASNGGYEIKAPSTAPVPEPATLTLMGLGIAGVIARRRGRRLRTI